MSVSFDSTGSRIASGRLDKTVRVLDDLELAGLDSESDQLS